MAGEAHQTGMVREGDGGLIWQSALAVDKTRQQGETAMGRSEGERQQLAALLAKLAWNAADTNMFWQ
jgi:hypothetical protein